MTNLSVNEIKLKQYVLIAKAGLAVVELKEKGMNSIEDANSAYCCKLGHVFFVISAEKDGDGLTRDLSRFICLF
jgi:hypothetical protein